MTCALGPALADPRTTDRYAFGITFAFFVVPFFIVSCILVIATDCGSANRATWLIVYDTAGEMGIAANLYVGLCFLAVNRMRGMEGWWNPLNLRKRTLKGFKF